jgi:hypothetical protein
VRHGAGIEPPLTLFLLKLIIVPVLLGLISLAGRRWGPGVAGWLAGFPVLTGPILVFLAVERGDAFAAQAAIGSLAAVSAATSFNLVYARVCQRAAWPLSVLAGLSAWLLVAAVLQQAASSVWISLAFALGALLLAPRLFPRVGLPQQFRPLPRSELFLRMAAAAVLTVLVTGVAATIGPAWSGLFAVFPLIALVLATFSHSANGPAFVIPLFRGMVAGHYSFSVFCLAVALLLGAHGAAVAFTVATALALATQLAAKAITSLPRAARATRAGRRRPAATRAK